MNLYKIQSNDVNIVKEKPFKLEKDIQSIFENNLSSIMDLQLVKSEFSIKNKRIDTLAMIKIYEVLKGTYTLCGKVSAKRNY